VQLILPLTTVLDDSIGCALWFAARGKGLLDGIPYTTTARVSMQCRNSLLDMAHINSYSDTQL